MKLNSSWASVGLFAAMQLIGKCKKNAFEIAHIYGATAYLKGVQMARDLFLYQIGILACVLLSAVGVILMETAVIFYIPVESSTRVILAFALGGIDFLTGAIFLGYYSSSERWLREASKYNAWVKATMDEKSFSRQKRG